MNNQRYQNPKKVPYRGDRNQYVPLGTVLLWKDYDEYVKLTKHHNHSCLNMSDVRWIKHYTMLKHLAPKEITNKDTDQS